MKHTATLLMADEKLNKTMRQLDMAPLGKVFITMLEIDFETSTPVDEDYFNKMIESQSKVIHSNNSHYSLFLSGLAGVIYGKNIFLHPFVRIVSDGKHEMFIPSRFI